MTLKNIFKKLMFRLFAKRGFGKLLVESDQSAAYGEFCEKVYGRNLCQLNVLDEEQLVKLLLVLNLNKSHKVLDLGCGIGRVSEYISDITGAQVTGIDFAPKAIESAQSRTVDKRNRLKFICGDFNSLPESIGSFDCIIAIDTLYFTDDLGGTLKAFMGVLKPGGQFASFYSTKLDAEESKENLLPENTKLALALRQSGYDYKFWDFSANDSKIWHQSLKVAEDLKEKFQAEKNFDLYKMRINESHRLLKSVEKGLNSRYLYHVAR